MRKVKPSIWANRIVKYGEVDVEQAIPNEGNWRVHPHAQQNAFDGVADDVGIVQNVIVNLRKGEEWGARQNIETMVDGHLRIMRALARGQKTLPATYVDLSPKDEAEVLATLDPLGAMAATDAAKLDELLRDVNSGNSAVTEMLAELAEKAGLQYGAQAEETTDVDALVDKAAELQAKWKVAKGDIWQVGRHRLMCGDSTSAEDVARLMGDNRLRLFVTDPPYGVDYSAKNEYLNAVAKGNSVQTPIANDRLNAVDQKALWLAAFKTAFDVAEDGCPYYVNSPQGGDLMMMMMMMMKEAGWLLKPHIIWVKNNHVLGRSDYQLKHEPIMYGWKPGTHWFYGNRSQFSVWEVDKPTNSDMHPTMKPIELPLKAIENSSKAGDLVGDWFVGSGTTLAACERLGRTGRGMELTEPYCAVTLERLTLLGLEAKRL